jgi:hypothetical protein
VEGPMRKIARSRITGRRARVGLIAALAVVPFAVQAAELAMLDALSKGEWTLRVRSDGSTQRICVRDGREFIQLRHKQRDCSRFVVRDGPEEVVVQYTCRGNGYGRTSIRRESNGLVQVESQGIIDGAPFAMSGEARLSGNC